MFETKNIFNVVSIDFFVQILNAKMFHLILNIYQKNIPHLNQSDSGAEETKVS